MKINGEADDNQGILGVRGDRMLHHPDAAKYFFDMENHRNKIYLIHDNGLEFVDQCGKALRKYPSP